MSSGIVYPSKYYLKPSLDENEDRTIVLSRSIFSAIIFLWIFIWYLVGFLNLFPQIPWGYGFIWHVFNFLAIPATFIVSYTYYRPIINIVLVIAIINVIVDIFAACLILYSLSICYIESIPTNCINLQFTFIIISLLSLILVILSITILFSIVSLTRRINNAVIFRKNSIRKMGSQMGTQQTTKKLNKKFY